MRQRVVTKHMICDTNDDDHGLGCQSEAALSEKFSKKSEAESAASRSLLPVGESERLQHFGTEISGFPF
jgi:hypothetical protein